MGFNEIRLSLGVYWMARSYARVPELLNDILGLDTRLVPTAFSSNQREHTHNSLFLFPRDFRTVRGHLIYAPIEHQRIHRKVAQSNAIDISIPPRWSRRNGRKEAKRELCNCNVNVRGNRNRSPCLSSCRSVASRRVASRRIDRTVIALSRIPLYSAHVLKRHARSCAFETHYRAGRYFHLDVWHSGCFSADMCEKS